MLIRSQACGWPWALVRSIAMCVRRAAAEVSRAKRVAESGWRRAVAGSLRSPPILFLRDRNRHAGTVANQCRRDATIQLCIGARWSVVGGRWSVVDGRWLVVGGRCRRQHARPSTRASACDEVSAGISVRGGHRRHQRARRTSQASACAEGIASAACAEVSVSVNLCGLHCKGLLAPPSVHVTHPARLQWSERLEIIDGSTERTH